jgi:hypothetical protein
MASIGEALRSFALLAALGFSAFMPLVAGYELYRVQDVSRWPLVPARIVGATLEASTSRKTVTSWRYRMVDLQMGKAIDTGDMRPGDLPFSLVIWSTANLDAAQFQANAGRTVMVRRSPDGSEYYPEAGNMRFMTGVLGFCGLFWIGLFWRNQFLAEAD